MYFNLIHANRVTFAHILALRSGLARSPRRPFLPLARLKNWWRGLGEAEGELSDPKQIMLYAECLGRPYATALSGVLLMNYIRRRREARGDTLS